MDILLGLAFLSMSPQEMQDLNETVQIIEHLQPDVSDRYAIELAVSVNQAVIKYDLPKEKFLAILFQESSLRTDPKDCAVEVKNCTPDFGIGQVNFPVWGDHLKMDRIRALTDVAYSVELSAKVLHSYKRFKKHERNWWSRYHSKTSERRKDYEERILYHYGKIVAEQKEIQNERQRAQIGKGKQGQNLLAQGFGAAYGSACEYAALRVCDKSFID